MDALLKRNRRSHGSQLFQASGESKQDTREKQMEHYVLSQPCQHLQGVQKYKLHSEHCHPSAHSTVRLTRLVSITTEDR